MKAYILIFTILAGGYLFANGNQDIDMENLSEEVDATIVFIEGQVLLNGEEAAEGMKVLNGDVIETAFDGFCEITFLDRNVFQIWEDSLAVIQFEPEQSSISLEQGSMAALFDKLSALTQDNPFLVKTPTGIAGIRGTAFFIQIEDENNSYICACNGTVTAEYDGTELAELVGVHHKALRVSRSSDGSISSAAAPLLYHDDEDMETLSEAIRSDIDWGYDY